MKQAIQTIKDMIKANVAESHEIRKRIHAATGKDRYNLWDKKRYLGSSTREFLLAYGCLRGKLYAQIEPESSSMPSAIGVYWKIEAALSKDCPEKAEWTKERVRAWLVRPEALANKEAA
jgi:hypothetical protein